LNDGTTPTKGATHTHASLAAQCDSLAAAWEWRDDDLIYHALPLHHIHGIVNAWMCAHYVGARVEFGGVGVGPERRRREGDDGRARAQKGGGGETASHTTPFAWCTPFLKDFSRRHSSPALPFQRLTGKTFD